MAERFKSHCFINIAGLRSTFIDEIIGIVQSLLQKPLARRRFKQLRKVALERGQTSAGALGKFI